MFTLVFFFVSFAVMLSLYWYFKPAMLRKYQPVFSRFVRKRASDPRLSYVVLRFFVNHHMLNSMLKSEMGTKQSRHTRISSVLLLAAAEETNTFGLSEALSIVSKLIGWIFVLALFNMFKNFIIAGITEAVYNWIRDAEPDRIEWLIRHLPIRSQIISDLRNTLEAYKEHKEQKEGEEQGAGRGKK